MAVMVVTIFFRITIFHHFFMAETILFNACLRLLLFALLVLVLEKLMQ